MTLAQLHLWHWNRHKEAVREADRILTLGGRYARSRAKKYRDEAAMHLAAAKAIKDVLPT